MAAYPPLLASYDLVATPQGRDVSVELLQVQVAPAQLGHLLVDAKVQLHTLERALKQGFVGQNLCMAGFWLWQELLMCHRRSRQLPYRGIQGGHHGCSCFLQRASTRG